MRSFSKLALLSAATISAAGLGCNAILGLGDYGVGAPAGGDGGDDAADTGPTDSGGDTFVGECTTNRECTERFTAQGPVPFDASAPDGSDAAAFDAGTFGSIDGGVVPAVCVKPQYKCVRVLSEDCNTITGDWQDDRSVMLGTLFSTTGAQGATNIPRQNAAVMAAEEINSSIAGGGIPSADGGVRPIVVLSCDESKNLSRVGNHIVNELHVAGVVGPNTSQDTIDLTQKISAAGGTVLMTPTGVASSIADLPDNNLTWRAVPNDAVRAPLMIKQINELETEMKDAVGNPLGRVTPATTVRLAIIYRDDALGQATFASLTQSLTINGAALNQNPNVKIVPYNPASISATLGADVAAFAPDIIALIGTAESVTKGMTPVETAWATSTTKVDRPYYVLIDSNRVPELLAATQSNDGLRVRVRGTGLYPAADSSQVFTSFQLAYQVRYGSTPDISGLGPSYDAMYAFAFALAAEKDQPATGATIATGLRKLAGGPTRIEVGKQQALRAFGELVSGKAINAVGTFTPLEWDQKGDTTSGTIEMWCIGRPAGTVVYGHSGLFMDVKTQALSGAYTQCP